MKNYLTNTGVPCGLKKFDKSIADHKLELDLEDMFSFLKNRYYGSKDQLLNSAKFNNPFRELDKTSKWIFNNCSTEKDFYFARFINRIDVLEKGYPTESPFTNTQAYQISPSALRMRGYSNIAPLFEIDIPNKVNDVLKEAPDYDRMNKAFGGGVPFVMYQISLDLAWKFPLKYDRNLKPYYGSGSKHFNTELTDKQILAATSLHWPECPREVYLFDVENWLCEYRKYLTYGKSGIPFNRRRINQQKLF